MKIIPATDEPEYVGNAFLKGKMAFNRPKTQKQSLFNPSPKINVKKRQFQPAHDENKGEGGGGNQIFNLILCSLSAC